MAEERKAEAVRMNGAQCHNVAHAETCKAKGLEMGRDAVRGMR